LARELQAERPDMALILMSGYSGAALQNRDDKIPDVAVLEKPFTAAAVLKAVRNALEGGSGRGSVSGSD
jgi:FixJ family two-component response regulator